MKQTEPKTTKYLRLYYDKKFRHLSIEQLTLKYSVSKARIYKKLEQLEKQYPTIKKVLQHFTPSDLLNIDTLTSIVERLEAGKQNDTK